MSNKNKKVACHYRGTFDDGTQFDSSYDRGEPLEFICGAGQMIAGFDAAVEDMQVGEEKDVRLLPAEAYGEVDETLLLTFPLSDVPNKDEIKVGDRVMLQGPAGPVQAKVASKDDENLVLDLNHEMVGKALNFHIELVSVEQ